MRLVAEIPSLDWLDVTFRLAVAAGLGAVIGLERELDEKAAGLRTHMLVSLGAALFTMVGAYGFHDFLTGGGAIVRTDPSRIAAQVVTGIGFLGAGVIFRQGFTVRGLTRAASIWITAVGIGSHSPRLPQRDRRPSRRYRSRRAEQCRLDLASL